MRLLDKFILPDWKSPNILIDTYTHSSPGMAEEFMERFGEYFNNIDNKFCIRLVHIDGRDLPIFSQRLLPHQSGLTIQAFKNKTKYPTGTYVFISTEIDGEVNDDTIDEAIDVITTAVGLVRSLWGARTAWSLVQRSIVDASTGDMTDPLPAILIPNNYNRVWDDDISSEIVRSALNEFGADEKIRRSLRLVGRGSDPTELNMALWFWSAFEVLCDTVNESDIKRTLAKVYGCPDDWKTVGDKFGIRHIAQARHDFAHQGNIRKFGSIILEYYNSLYFDLLSGLYLDRCVMRAERMINEGFDIDVLRNKESSRTVLNIQIKD